MSKEKRKDKPTMPWELKEDNPCDRCGNKSHNYGSLYFPVSKIRIHLCDVCFYGLAMGLKFDIEKLLHRNG